MTAPDTEQQPFYVRGTYLLLFTGLVLAFIYIGKPVLVMVVAALLFAFLVLPLCRKLEGWRVPRGLASMVGVLTLMITIIGLFSFLSWESMSFISDFPALQRSIDAKIQQLTAYVENTYSISQGEQVIWMQQKSAELLNSGAGLLLRIFSATGSFLATFVLIPITMFFMLQYRDKFKKFVELVNPGQHAHSMEVARKISQVSQMYIRGIFIDILILTALNSLGFMLLGLKYAILLGLIAAVLNIIPYVGVLIGSLIPILIALVTKDSFMYAVGAFAVCAAVQFLDNNFITPKVVGSSVNLNPLTSILALLSGALIWGLVGMVLSIPLAGMFKVVCDNVQSLRPLGFLMGEEREYKPFNFKKLRLPRRKQATEIKES